MSTDVTRTHKINELGRTKIRQNKQALDRQPSKKIPEPLQNHRAAVPGRGTMGRDTGPMSLCVGTLEGREVSVTSKDKQVRLDRRCQTGNVSAGEKR